MQKLLAALFAFALLYVLHEHAQTGRYVASPDGSFVIDSQTGATYGAPQKPGDEHPPYGKAIR
ncbi:MAG: hypothetical protein JWP58_1781 [Hymenobacter sp.]|nr:hypothetical protein [Hymenobacter sp.]